MAETVEFRKSEVLKHLQCVICLGDVDEARLCPRCSSLFCDECIQGWLNNSLSCPACRTTLQYHSVVRGCSINQIQESIRLLFSSMDMYTKGDICDKHNDQIFSLFCFSCEANVCVGCLFSEEHVQHKEQIVLTEKAFEHYKQKMTPNLTRINKWKEVVDEILSKLNKEKEQIEKLCKHSATLFAGEVNPAIVKQIVEIDREMVNLRQSDADRMQQLQDCVARLKKENAEHVSCKPLFHQLGKEKRNWPLFWLKWIVFLGLILVLIFFYEHPDSDALSCQLHTLEPACTTWSGWCSVVSCVKWLYDQCYNWRND